MALIAPRISSLSCFASTNPNNSPTFLISKFHNTVASPSHANTPRRRLSSYVYSPVTSHLKQLDQKTSIVSYLHDQKTSIDSLHELNIKKVKNILVSNRDDPFKSLDLIDTIQCLGIDCHFRHEIEQTLQMIYKECTHLCGRDVREVALCFRLLRQEGHYVQESIFENILDKKNGFEDDPKNDDVKVLLELYEASELRLEGEETLEGVRGYTFNRLNELCSGGQSHQEREIMSSLAHPRHKTVRRLTSNRFISMIKIADQEDKKWLQSLLRVAEIDTITLKFLIQEEMSQIFKWWRELGLGKELQKIRDQPLKWYSWSMETLRDPTLTEQRVDLSKPVTFIYVIDDIFDLYGELDELILFTQAVERWDHKGLETLPRYMKVCFEDLDRITTEISIKICKSHGWDPTDSLRKSWANLCKAFLIEAKWFKSGYLPNTEEYMKNAVVSSGVHLAMLHVYFLLGEELTREKVELIESNPRIVSSAATILRLWDDLGSAKDENQDGTDGSYVDCYLNEYKGSTVDEARTHVVEKIAEAWKCLNRECISPRPFSRAFSNACLNVARTVSMMYSYDDDHSLPGLDEYLKSLM